MDDITGIGPKRRKALMMAFEGAEAMKSASLEDIMKVPSMDKKSAQSVYDYFHNNTGMR